MSTTKPMLPTATNRHHHRHLCLSSPRLHRGTFRAIFAACAALLIATPIWLSLVLSSSTTTTPHPFLSFHRLFHLFFSSPHPNSLPPLSSPDLPIPNHPFPSSHYALPDSTPFPSQNTPPLSLRHLVFGIAGSAHLWPRRREFVRLWWRPDDMRGHVWLDNVVPQSYTDLNSSSPFPPVRVSEDTSRFRYTNPTGHPSGLRIARVVSETFRLGLSDVRWFVLCDDDTIINPDNLVAVLSKYDWREMVYIGGPSESHSANTYFSHSMAFGGGGIAISYPLARALAEMQDECLERYPKLYGSDDRLHACISELGVPLTREQGFHQWDVRGNVYGLLAAHPITPFVSIHHVEAIDPLYPGLSSLESLKLFTKAMRTEPRSILQRSICYDWRKKLTFSVSLDYVVQVFPNIVLPRDLERSERTYTAWNWKRNKDEFDFDTRDAYKSVCKKPILFFLKDIRKDGNVTRGTYVQAKGRDELKRKVFCFPRSPPLHDVKEIRVFANPPREDWHLVPRRLCCTINQTRNEHLGLVVGQCDRLNLGSATGFV